MASAVIAKCRAGEIRQGFAEVIEAGVANRLDSPWCAPLWLNLPVSIGLIQCTRLYQGSGGGIEPVYGGCSDFGIGR